MNISSITDFNSLSKILSTSLGQVSKTGTREMILPDGSKYELNHLCQVIHATYDRNVHFDNQERQAARKVIAYTDRIYKQCDESLKGKSVMTRILVFVMDWFRYNPNSWKKEKIVWNHVVKLYTNTQCKGTDFYVNPKVSFKFKKETLFEVIDRKYPHHEKNFIKCVTEDNLVLKAFQFLDVKTLATLRRVNREWNQLASNCFLYRRENEEPCDALCSHHSLAVASHSIGYNLRNSICQVQHYRVSTGDGHKDNYHPKVVIVGNKFIVALTDGFEVFDIRSQASIKRISGIPGNAFQPNLNQENLPLIRPFIQAGHFQVQENPQLIVTSQGTLSFWDLKTLTCTRAFQNIPQGAQIKVDNECEVTSITYFVNRLVISTLGSGGNNPVTIDFPAEDLVFNEDPFGLFMPLEAINLDAFHINVPVIKPRWHIDFDENAIYYSPKKIISYNKTSGLEEYTINFPLNTFLIGFEKISSQIMACQLKIVDDNGPELNSSDHLQLRCIKTGEVLHDYPSFWMYGHASRRNTPVALSWEWARSETHSCQSNQNIMMVLDGRDKTKFHTIDIKTGALICSIEAPILFENRLLEYYLINEKLYVQIQTRNQESFDIQHSIAVYNPLTGECFANYPNMGDYQLETLGGDHQVIIFKNYLLNTRLFMSALNEEILGTYREPALGRYTTFFGSNVDWVEGKQILNVNSKDQKATIEFDLLNFSPEQAFQS